MNDLLLRYLFINISRSKKYMCRVTKSCVFKLLQNLENWLQNYPENPENCVSGIPDFKIFPGEHAPPPTRQKNAQVVQGWWKQPWTMLCCPHCSTLSTTYIVQHCWAWISPQSGVTMLNNIVDNIEQCGQHSIVQGCFYQPWTGCAFLRVYIALAFGSRLSAPTSIPWRRHCSVTPIWGCLYEPS